MKVQRASEGQKYGDINKDHTLALDRVIQFWADYSHPKYGNWIIDEAWVEQYSPQFIKENPDRNKDNWCHTPDICFFEWCQDQPVPKLMIEVDGKSHSAKTRQISDGLFEKWIQQHYHGTVQLIRIDTQDINGDNKLAVQELKDKLGDYLAVR